MDTRKPLKNYLRYNSPILLIGGIIIGLLIIFKVRNINDGITSDTSIVSTWTATIEATGYVYDQGTHQLKSVKDGTTLYQFPSTIEYDGEEQEATVHIIGQDGTKLIIWHTTYDNSPGPRWEMEIRLSDVLEYINIANPSAGPQPYVVTEDKKAEAQNNLDIYDEWNNVTSPNRSNMPARILSYNEGYGDKTLMLDKLVHNPDFLPGLTEFFMNNGEEIESFVVNSGTKVYSCGEGGDNDWTTADVEIPLETLIDLIRTRDPLNELPVDRYFDIEENVIKNIYEQCLP